MQLNSYTYSIGKRKDKMVTRTLAIKCDRFKAEEAKNRILRACADTEKG